MKEFKPITTQAELDAVISERLRRERNKTKRSMIELVSVEAVKRMYEFIEFLKCLDSE